jgi:hypothetical protein
MLNGLTYAWLFFAAVAWRPRFQALGVVMADFLAASLASAFLPRSMAPVACLYFCAVVLLMRSRRPERPFWLWVLYHTRSLLLGAIASLLSWMAMESTLSEHELVWTCIGALVHTGLVALVLDWTHQRTEMVLSLTVWIVSQVAAMTLNSASWSSLVIQAGQLLVWLAFVAWRIATANPRQRAQTFVNMQPVSTVDTDERPSMRSDDDLDTFAISDSSSATSVK